MEGFREGLTAEQAGRVLGVTAARVRQLMRDGKLEAWEGDDGRYLFDQEQVRQLSRDRNAGRVRVARGSGLPETAADLEAVLTRVLDAAMPRAVEAATADLRRDLERERAARVKAEREAAKWRARAGG